MLSSRAIAACISGFTGIVALTLVIDRGGLIAWSVFIVSVIFFYRFHLKPSRLDLGMSIGLALFSLLAWIGTFYYVITTYESGEVVELDIHTENELRTARLWVFEIGAELVVYIDAVPDVANSLLAGRPLQLRREGQVSTRIPRASQIELLAEENANLVMAAMETKYQDRMTASTVYYLFLGRPRDRIALVVELIEE